MVELQRDDQTPHSAPASPRITNKSPFRSQVSQNGRMAAAQHQRSRNFHSDASLVLVGVRGSGKRSLGLIAATALGRRFITEDFYFQNVTGLTRQDYLKVHGSEEFHKQDVEITRKMLEDNRSKCVIDCGLGSLTSSLQEYLKQYCLKNPVVYLLRDMEQIQSLLNLGERSARLLEAGDPSHRKCSNFEYYNLQEPSVVVDSENYAADRTSPTYSFKLRQAQEDFSRFVRFVTGNLDQADAVSHFSVEVPVQNRAFTHALELRLSIFERGINFTELHTAGDVVEVVIDQWNHASAKAATKLVAMARRFARVPVLYSVRLPNVHIDSQLAILNHGLRLGVEYLSVDLQMETDSLRTLSAMKGRTKLIGFYVKEDTIPLGWKAPHLKTMLEKAISLRCDAVRIVFPSSSSATEDVISLSWFKEEIKAQNVLDVPVIAYNSGLSGRTSQLLNNTLTSVTHEALGAISRLQAPLITSKDATKALFDCFVLDPLNFCIIGGNVTQSLSPPMHNAAYTYLGLQHSYTTRNIKTWADIQTLADDHFGGASVVQPWKVKIVEKVTSLSHHGKAIGAVNTLIPLRASAGGRPMSLEAQAFNRNRAGPVVAWHAENTDWLGIRVCISRSLSPRNVIQPRTTGLVIGAGGMARAAVYALLQMGCRHVFMYNRTLANARLVADHFNNWLNIQTPPDQVPSGEAVRVLESLKEPWPQNFSMPTMIVSCVTHEVLDGNPGADFEMPTQWLESPSGGVAVEMAYMTSATALIRQMREFRQITGLPWVIVDGIETLIEQAIGQFEIMTGRNAPRKVMTEAIRATLRENHQYVADGEVYNV